MPNKIDTVTDLFRAIGSDAVAMQEGWDRAFQIDAERFAQSLPALERVLGQGAYDLGPRRLQLGEHRMEVRLQIETRRTIEGGLGVQIFNHSWDLAYARSSRTQERDSRLVVLITQVPSSDGNPETHSNTEDIGHE